MPPYTIIVQTLYVPLYVVEDYYSRPIINKKGQQSRKSDNLQPFEGQMDKTSLNRIEYGKTGLEQRPEKISRPLTSFKPKGQHDWTTGRVSNFVKNDNDNENDNFLVICHDNEYDNDNDNVICELSRHCHCHDNGKSIPTIIFINPLSAASKDPLAKVIIPNTK